MRRRLGQFTKTSQGGWLVLGGSSCTVLSKRHVSAGEPTIMKSELGAANPPSAIEIISEMIPTLSYGSRILRIVSPKAESLFTGSDSKELCGNSAAAHLGFVYTGSCSFLLPVLPPTSVSEGSWRSVHGRVHTGDFSRCLSRERPRHIFRKPSTRTEARPRVPLVDDSYAE
jgi:hypothetical protein